MHHTRACTSQRETLENSASARQEVTSSKTFSPRVETRGREVTGDHTEWPEVKSAETRRNRVLARV
jgi:hypothetical protein